MSCCRRTESKEKEWSANSFARCGAHDLQNVVDTRDVCLATPSKHLSLCAWRPDSTGELVHGAVTLDVLARVSSARTHTWMSPIPFFVSSRGRLQRFVDERFCLNDVAHEVLDKVLCVKTDRCRSTRHSCVIAQPELLCVVDGFVLNLCRFD